MKESEYDHDTTPVQDKDALSMAINATKLHTQPFWAGPERLTGQPLSPGSS